MIRIATGGFCHETNSFGNILVTQDVLNHSITVGDSWFRYHTGIRSYNGGYIDEAKELGIEMVPALTAGMAPSGPTEQAPFEWARDRMVELLWESYQKQPFDAIALFLHGAGVAHGYPDLEGEILRAVRAKFGPEIPIGVSLDLHGNISPAMAELATILVGCKSYPHVDEYDCGRIVIRLLHDMLVNNYRPCMKLIKLPWLFAPACGLTTSGPAGDVRALLLQKEADDPDLLQASFFHGFPYADIKEASVSVVTAAKTQESADRNARLIAEYAWNRRHDFAVPLYSAKEAVDEALKFEEGPVVINEGSDNPGGGTPGDGTHLLRELLERNIPNTAFGYIRDPEVVQQAIQAGVGAHISCRLGGKSDIYHGEPIEIKDAYVKCISDGKFIRQSPMGYGTPTDLGDTVCLVIGNVSVVVACGRTQTFDNGPFKLGGIDWTEMRILALKSAQHFKGWWGSRVKGIIPCDSPGIHSSNLSTIPFRNVNLSYYPLQDAQWEE